MNQLVSKLNEMPYLLVFEDIDEYSIDKLPDYQRIDLFIWQCISECSQVKILCTLRDFIGMQTQLPLLYQLCVNNSVNRNNSFVIHRHNTVNSINNSITAMQTPTQSRSNQEAYYQRIERKDSDSFLLSEHIRPMNVMQLKSLTNQDSVRLLQKRLRACDDKKILLADLEKLRLIAQWTYGIPSCIIEMCNKVIEPKLSEFYARFDPSSPSVFDWTQLASILREFSQSYFSTQRNLWKSLDLHIITDSDLIEIFKNENDRRQWIDMFGYERNGTWNTIAKHCNQLFDLHTHSNHLTRTRKPEDDRPLYLGDDQQFSNEFAISELLPRLASDNSICHFDFSLSVPLSIYAKLINYLKLVIRLIMHPAIESLYFQNRPRIIAGFISADRAKKWLLDPDIPIKTALIKFSVSQPGSLVVIYKSTPRKCVKSKIDVHLEDTGATFSMQYDQFSSIHENSLEEILKKCSFMEYLWYRKWDTSVEILNRKQFLKKFHISSKSKK